MRRYKVVFGVSSRQNRTMLVCVFQMQHMGFGPRSVCQLVMRHPWQGSSHFGLVRGHPSQFRPMGRFASWACRQHLQPLVLLLLQDGVASIGFLLTCAKVAAGT